MTYGKCEVNRLVENGGVPGLRASKTDLAPLQLETRFRGLKYLELVYEWVLGL